MRKSPIDLIGRRCVPNPRVNDVTGIKSMSSTLCSCLVGRNKILVLRIFGKMLCKYVPVCGSLHLQVIDCLTVTETDCIPTFLAQRIGQDCMVDSTRQSRDFTVINAPDGLYLEVSALYVALQSNQLGVREVTTYAGSRRR